MQEIRRDNAFLLHQVQGVLLQIEVPTAHLQPDKDQALRLIREQLTADHHPGRLHSLPDRPVVPDRLRSLPDLPEVALVLLRAEV